MKSQFPNHSADSADISESYLQKFEDCHVFYSHNDHIFAISIIHITVCRNDIQFSLLLNEGYIFTLFFGHMKNFYLTNCLYLVGLGIPPACL